MIPKHEWTRFPDSHTSEFTSIISSAEIFDPQYEYRWVSDPSRSAYRRDWSYDFAQQARMVLPYAVAYLAGVVSGMGALYLLSF